MKPPSLFAVVGVCLCAGILTSCRPKTQTPANVAVAPTRILPTPKPTARVLPAALKGQMMPGVWVLCYHRIDDKPAQYTVLPPADFEAQMDFLKTHDYNVVPLTRIVDALQYGEKLTPNTVALTFDDGFKDNYTVAYPLLKQYNYSATLFIYPNYISNGGAALSWEQLKEMAADPLITVESHTLSHPNLVRMGRRRNAAEYAAKLSREVRQSKAILKEKLGVTTQFLAYPYGVYDPKVLTATRGAGYRAAFGIGTRPIHFIGAKPTDLWTVPRIMVNRGDSLQLWASRLQTPKPRIKKKPKQVAAKKS